MPDTIKLSELPSLPFTQRAKLPECSAVYFALDANRKLLYIGSAEKLRNRIARHHRRHELATIAGARIAWLAIDEPDLLPDLETHLIKQMKPPMNRSPVITVPGQLVMLGSLVPKVIHSAVGIYARRERRTVSDMVRRILEDHPEIKAIMEGSN